MEIAILLYDRFATLDVMGPYEVLSRLPDATVTFVGTNREPVRAETDPLTVLVGQTLAEARRPDVVVVPGGSGQVAVMRDPNVLSWLQDVHQTTAWTTSVCTGSLVLAAAGLLAGRRAATHWVATDLLAALGAEPAAERVVVDGKLVTAAGVSAGIDMALTLAARVAGATVAQAIQLLIEYDPSPPFDAGSPEAAPAQIVDILRARRQEILQTGSVDLRMYSAPPAPTPGVA